MKRLLVACLLLAACTPATAANPAAQPAAAASAPAASATDFTGSGNFQTPAFKLLPGRRTFAYTHEGDGAFVVTLKSADGTVDQPLAWTAGKTDTSATFDVETEGSFFLKVEATGKWTISVD
jgi:hypothetical protein